MYTLSSLYMTICSGNKVGNNIEAAAEGGIMTYDVFINCVYIECSYVLLNALKIYYDTHNQPITYGSA